MIDGTVRTMTCRRPLPSIPISPMIDLRDIVIVILGMNIHPPTDADPDLLHLLLRLAEEAAVAPTSGSHRFLLGHLLTREGGQVGVKATVRFQIQPRKPGTDIDYER